MLVTDLDIRIIDAATGELLRELVLDPDRDYQPLGNAKAEPESGSALANVLRHHMSRGDRI